MPFLTKKNFAKGSLASGITAVATQVTLTAGHNLPTTGSFRAIIWNVNTYPSYPPDDSNMEFVTATLNAGNVYNITRAQEETVAAAHSANDRMALHLTAGQIQELETAIDGEGHITILPWFYNSITSGTWTLFSTGSGVTNQILGDWSLRATDNLSQVDYKVYLAPGTYTFSLITVKNVDRGIIDVLIDGASVGTMDGYSATLTYNAKLSVTGIAISTGGLKTLSIKVNGKNASSTNYLVDLFCLALWRTA